MSDENFIWAAAGMILGLAAGVLAGRISSRRAIGPRERAYTWRNCWITGLLLGLFLASAVGLPKPQRYIVPGLLFLVIPALVYRWSVRRLIIRRREERDLRGGATAPPDRARESRPAP